MNVAKLPAPDRDAVHAKDKKILQGIPGDAEFTITFRFPIILDGETPYQTKTRYTELVAPTLDTISGVSDHYMEDEEEYGLFIELSIDPDKTAVMDRTVSSLYGSVVRALRSIYPIDVCV